MTDNPYRNPSDRPFPAPAWLKQKGRAGNWEPFPEGVPKPPPFRPELLANWADAASWKFHPTWFPGDGKIYLDGDCVAAKYTYFLDPATGGPLYLEVGATYVLQLTVDAFDPLGSACTDFAGNAMVGHDTWLWQGTVDGPGTFEYEFVATSFWALTLSATFKGTATISNLSLRKAAT